MRAIIGWDIGGAHLKAARAEDGHVVGFAQVATPLWRGLDSLHAAFAEIQSRLGLAETHSVTMTGELCDAFASRREGVIGLAEIAGRHLGQGMLVYAGRAGFVPLAHVVDYTGEIASANWRASAEVVAVHARDALFIDMGSTTTDIIPIISGNVSAVGEDDAGRLAAGELIYTGLTRSFVMAMARRAPFAGVWTPLMNEYFASAADVRRILGDLPEGADLMATADGREKSAEASRARLARMIGRDPDDAPKAAWEALSAWFAEAQVREICDGVYLKLSRGDVAESAIVVAAGIGDAVVREVARRLGRTCVGFAELISGCPEVGQCAPAAAVALLLARRQSRAPVQRQPPGWA